MHPVGSATSSGHVFLEVATRRRQLGARGESRGVWGRRRSARPSTATLAEELTQPLALHTLHR
jgi:hypothetical protein